MSRSLDLGAKDDSFDLEIEPTAAFIRHGAYVRVALQFPDQLLQHASDAVDRLSQALIDDGVELFILGDTSFDGFQVDFVAAQHLNADAIVHYGPVDLEADGPLPVRFVFGRRPLDVDALAAALTSTFGDGQRVLLVPSLPYAHLASSIAERVLAACSGMIVCYSDVERAAEATASEGDEQSDPLVAAAALAAGRLLGRRLSSPLPDEALEGCSLVYVGDEDQTLSNLCMLLSQSAVYCIEASACALRALTLGTARRLMRRYYLLQQAREADIVGVLIGTLSASRRRPMLRALKELCRRAGRKHYVFVMGKLNAAKLANFAEVGVYVLLGSAEHGLLDSKEFYRPVVTPYEAHVALSDGVEWTGEYLLDYARLLPRLAAGEQRAINATNAAGAVDPVGAVGAADAADAADAAAHLGDVELGGSDEDAPPTFSLLSGRLIAKRTAASLDAEASARRDPSAAMPTDRADGSDGTLSVTCGELAHGGQYSVARSGAEALARREYRGLDPRIGQHAPSRIVDGRSGIASGFAGEGVQPSQDQEHQPNSCKQDT